MSDRTEQFRALLKQGLVIPAHPLALTEDLKLDERRQRALTRYYCDAGSGGVAVGVHTTQFSIRDSKVGLIEPVLELALEEVRSFEKRTGKVLAKIGGICAIPNKPARKLPRSAGWATMPDCSASPRSPRLPTVHSSSTAAPSEKRFR